MNRRVARKNFERVRFFEIPSFSLEAHEAVLQRSSVTKGKPCIERGIGDFHESCRASDHLHSLAGRQPFIETQPTPFGLEKNKSEKGALTLRSRVGAYKSLMNKQHRGVVVVK